jgi:hypothetical protein
MSHECELGVKSVERGIVLWTWRAWTPASGTLRRSRGLFPAQRCGLDPATVSTVYDGTARIKQRLG